MVTRNLVKKRSPCVLLFDLPRSETRFLPRSKGRNDTGKVSLTRTTEVQPGYNTTGVCEERTVPPVDRPIGRKGTVGGISDDVVRKGRCQVRRDGTVVYPRTKNSAKKVRIRG